MVRKNNENEISNMETNVTKTENTIILDNTNNSKTLYLEDSNSAKYSYYNHELTEPTLTVSAGQTKEVTIKFYSSYVSTKKVRYIVFSNITSVNGQISEKIEFKANV